MLPSTLLINNEIKQVFKLTKKGFWNHSFEFANKQGELVLSLAPLMTWRKWTKDLGVESRPEYSSLLYINELMTYCGFTVRLTQQSAASGF